MRDWHPYYHITTMNDHSCRYSRGPTIDIKVNMAIGFVTATTTTITTTPLDQLRRRRTRRPRQHHHSQLLQTQRRQHTNYCFLRPTSSSASIFCFLVTFLALSASSCWSFSFSSIATPTTSKTLGISRDGNTIRDSLHFHYMSLSSSSSSQRTLHHNMSALADVPQSSSSPPTSLSSSSSSSNSFQRRMEKLVRRNNYEHINNIISRSRRGEEIEDSAGKYSQYGNNYVDGSRNHNYNNKNNNNNNYHNLKTVHTLLEYKQVLDECRQEGSQEGKIVVVRFFATWCKVREMFQIVECVCVRLVVQL